MCMVLNVKLSGPVLLHWLLPMHMVVGAIFSLVERLLPQLLEEAALLHLVAPPAQPHVEEHLGVDSPARPAP